MNSIEICHYCKEPTDAPTKDHVFPKAKLRKLIAKGEPIPEGIDLHDNKVIACVACNALKGTLDYDSFMQLGLTAIRHMKKQFLSKQHNKKSKTYKYKRRKFKYK